MAQFDVHRAPGRLRQDVPYVVVVQSGYYSATPNRLVIPLVRAEPLGSIRPPTHLPRFEIEGRDVILDPLRLQPVPRAVLGPVVASLADDNSAVAIITAIDEVISRSYG